MPEPVHDLCYLTDRDGGIAPVHREIQALDREALAGRDLEIHVFTTPGEAAAFAAGTAVLASNRLRLRTGLGPLAHLAVLERLDADGPGRIALVDHGGARPTQNARRWAWLTRFARTWDRTGHRHPAVMFEAPLGDAPARLKIEHHRFTVAQQDKALILTCPIPAEPAIVQARITADPAALQDGVEVDSEGLRITVPRDRLGDRIEALHALVRVLHQCGFEQERRAKREATRHDRAHCRIVERMLQGWTLTNNHGRGDLKPPAGVRQEGRTIGYAMLDRLIDADLIRPPAGWETRGHRQWGAVYQTGDLTGSGVRRPEPAGEQGRTPGAPA